MRIPKGHPYRKQIRNGPVVERGASANRQGSRSRRPVSPSGRSGHAAGPDGSRVLGAVILAGAVIASGFLFALQSQKEVRRLGREDAKFKAEFYDLAKRQRVEEFRQHQAIDEVQRKVLALPRGIGLAQPTLQRTARSAAAPAVRSVSASRESGGQRERNPQVIKPATSRPASSLVAPDESEALPRQEWSREPAVDPVVQTRTALRTRPRRIEALASEQ